MAQPTPLTVRKIESLPAQAHKICDGNGLWLNISATATKSWTVPAERMKGRAPHRVPLSTQALRVLADARGLEAHSFGSALCSVVWHRVRSSAERRRVAAESNAARGLSELRRRLSLRRATPTPQGQRSNARKTSSSSMGEFAASTSERSGDANERQRTLSL